MAARIDRVHSERVRARIKLSQLVTRLENNALGKIEMTEGQRDAAKFLIARAMAPPAEDKNLKMSGDLKIELLSFADSQTAE